MGDHVVTEYGIIGALIAVLYGSVIAIWRKCGGFVSYTSFDRKIKERVDECHSKHEQQSNTNIKILERLTVVETKVDMGFKALSDKIEDLKD